MEITLRLCKQHMAVSGCLIALTVGFGMLSGSPAQAADARVWITTQDLTHKLSPGPSIQFAPTSPAIGASATAQNTLRVSTKIGYQTMLGMGSSLEHSTCYNLSRLSPAERDKAIKSLVDPGTGIGMNLMRICIGTPDFTGDRWYSYDDPPDDKPDADLRHFSIDRDRIYILPVLKAALAHNPQLLLFASPWSPPGWMKSTGSMIGGHLLPKYYAAYAAYFVKFLQAYDREGLPIYAVTVQNEPGVDRQHDEPKWRYPSCRWTGDLERDFIRDHLGPAIRRSGLATKIWCYDHNYNVAPTPDGDDPGIAYPRQILSDPRAAQYVAGVAFHGYAGKPEGMRAFHKESPKWPMYFTEGSVYGLPGAKRLIELLAHGASSYNAWVTMIDDKGKPNNGPFRASRTCIVLNTKRLAVDYTLDYYLYGQFMKFIRRGAVRIEVVPPDSECPAIAFKNPNGEIVVVAVNQRIKDRPVEIVVDQSRASLPLAARSVTTVVWDGGE
jgi:glucosylceramidase